MEAFEPLTDPCGAGQDATSEALAAACQLAAAVIRTPCESLMDDLGSGRLARVTDALAAWAGAPRPRTPHAPPDAGALQAAHTALFVSRAGGVPAPPYLGLLRDPELMGASARRLCAELQGMGLRSHAAWRELPDHLAAVAEAADLLLERGRRAEAEDLARRYLAPWFDRYADAVAGADETGFYGEIAILLRRVLAEASA